MDESSDGGIWGRLCVRGVGGVFAGIAICGGGFLAIAREWGRVIDLLVLLVGDRFSADGGDVYRYWQRRFTAGCFWRRQIQF